MFKGLVSRVVRAVSVRTPTVKDLAGAASEAKLPGTSSSPSNTQSSTRRNPLGISGQPMADPQAARAGAWGLWRRLGQREELESTSPQPASGGSDTALLSDLISNIDRILAVQQVELAEQEEQQRQSLAHSLLEEQELDMTAHIEAIRRVTGYTFKDPEYVRGAILKHKRAWKGKDIGRRVQLQLALIGDKFLDFGSLSANFGHGKDLERPGWGWLMSNKVLHHCAQRSGLPRMLAECGYPIGIQGDSNKGFGTMVEAIIGGVYQDSGRDGVVTDAVTTKLLGTSMLHKDVGKFAAAHASNVVMPSSQLWWRDLILDEVRSIAERAGRPDEVDQIMRTIEKGANSVDDYRTTLRKRLVAAPRKPINKTRSERDLVRSLMSEGRRKEKVAKTRQLKGWISGEQLQRYIVYIKHRRGLMRRKIARGAPQRKVKKAERLQAYLVEAEGHLSRGEAYHTL